MSLLDKIRNQPEYIRKIIVWFVVIIFGLILLFFWLKVVSSKIKEVEKEDFLGKTDFSEIKDGFKNIPKIEILELTEEEQKQLEEELKKLEQENQE